MIVFAKLSNIETAQVLDALFLDFVLHLLYDLFIIHICNDLELLEFGSGFIHWMRIFLKVQRVV